MSRRLQAPLNVSANDDEVLIEDKHLTPVNKNEEGSLESNQNAASGLSKTQTISLRKLKQKKPKLVQTDFLIKR